MTRHVLPEPGLAELDGLVDQLREAGLQVDVERVGSATDLPPGLDRAAYRILQEALTNVLRHAGATSAGSPSPSARTVSS